MGQIVFGGQLVAGPPQGGERFPASTISVTVGLKSEPKGFGSATGVIQRSLISAVYTTLSGVGAGDTVQRGDFLYFRTNSPVLVRLTTDDGTGNDVVSVIPVDGLLTLEFPTNKALTLLEVNGNASFEYLVSGP